MNVTPLEERFFDYLSGLSRYVNTNGLRFDSSNSLVNIDTPELFHDVCRALGVDRLRARGTLYYFQTRIPNSESRFGDPLVIKLTGRQGRTFLEKYGNGYTIIPLHKESTY